MTSTTSRRTFLGATGVAVAALAVPLPLLAREPLTLHGDGLHDDTAALEALFAGEPVHVANTHVVARHENGTVRLLNGDFLTHRPVRADAATNLYCGGCTFRLGATSASPHPWLEAIG